MWLCTHVCVLIAKSTYACIDSILIEYTLYKLLFMYQLCLKWNTVAAVLRQPGTKKTPMARIPYDFTVPQCRKFFFV